MSEFTIERIKNREFEKAIPELYELENVVENSPWHDNDPVFNHTLSVTKELKNSVEVFADEIKKRLDEKIKNYSKKELLILVAIFHDIGKKEALREGNNTTLCLGHEKIGAEKLKNILTRFDLAEEERNFVIKIVGNHGFIHGILNHPVDRPEEKWHKFKEENPDISLEIALLTKADTLTSYLKISKPREFAFRLNFIDRILDYY